MRISALGDAGLKTLREAIVADGPVVCHQRWRMCGVDVPEECAWVCERWERRM